jgi:hypothetical protein
VLFGVEISGRLGEFRDTWLIALFFKQKKKVSQEINAQLLACFIFLSLTKSGLFHRAYMTLVLGAKSEHLWRRERGYVASHPGEDEFTGRQIITMFFCSIQKRGMYRTSGTCSPGMHRNEIRLADSPVFSASEDYQTVLHPYFSM